ncbi:hypothetical protein APR04_000888 [Promicromonospora umidemergens]|uniref:T6SS immunity protein Tdi1 C-terminal domain-containing protein n=1 Tax=Promicromonospora umidemergens TaxID=629679 RepID=A0ABP8XQE9_9MICO|nr:DUF1851 domain-containing protein [Promicromonospora umidemergens]MCP2281993.1 hypothetical protein [Promicromonospora umidemergens]
MRRVHLIREFAPDAYEFALSSWSWIGTGDKTPRFASCFGDMFLESPDGWWFLDTVEGTLERRWSSMDAMFADLEGEDGRAEFLLEETLNAALGQGLLLGEDEVFAFLPPPAVTGTMSVDSLAPLRFAIAANLAGRIHGELNGVQPDAGASALFAAQQAAAQQAAALKYAEQTAAAQGAAPTFDAPNPQTDRWEPSAQQVNTGAYPAYRPTPVPGYVDARHESAGHGRAGYERAGYERAAHQASHEVQYAAGSELDYGSGQPDAYGSGGYAATPGGHGGHSGYSGYDYVDNSHTADSGQFSQYIADQYNTGQVAAVEYGAPAPAQPKPHQDGRWSYA